MNVTTADVQRVAQTYFNEPNRVVLHILPRAGRVEMNMRVAGRERDALCWVGRDAVRLGGAWRRTRTRTPNWPSSGRRGRCAARQVNFPPYEVRTLANGMQVITVLHHEQPAVTMRLLVRRRRGAGPAGQGRASRASSAQLLDQGTTTTQRRADCRRDRHDRRRARHRLGHRPHFAQRRRDEGFVRRRRWTCWPTSSATRRSRRRRSSGRSSR